MNLLFAFGQAIRIARDQAGLTQQDLSEKSGVHVVTLSRIERGTAEPRLLTMEQLAHALSTTLSEMIRRAEAIQRTQN